VIHLACIEQNMRGGTELKMIWVARLSVGGFSFRSLRMQGKERGVRCLCVYYVCACMVALPPLFAPLLLWSPLSADKTPHEYGRRELCWVLITSHLH